SGRVEGREGTKRDEQGGGGAFDRVKQRDDMGDGLGGGDQGRIDASGHLGNVEERDIDAEVGENGQRRRHDVDDRLHRLCDILDLLQDWLHHVADVSAQIKFDVAELDDLEPVLDGSAETEGFGRIEQVDWLAVGCV